MGRSADVITHGSFSFKLASSYGGEIDLVEHIEKTFRFEATDSVPYWITMDDSVERRITSDFESGDWKEGVRPYIYGGHPVGSADYGKEVGPDSVVDPFGTTVKKGNIIHVIDYPLKEPSMAGYQWPDTEILTDWDALATEFEQAKGAYRACGMSFGLFERGWLLRGMNELLMDMIDNPEFVHQLFDGYADYKIRVLTKINERIPCEAIFGGGDDCDQRGPIMGLERWREFIRPGLERIINHTHSLGKPYIAHMCGNVMPIVDDLMEMGLDVLESLQPEAMDVYELKKKTQGRMALIGGVGVQSLLPHGTPEEIRAEVARLKQELGRGGGYVLSSAKPIMDDVPTENALAFIDEAMKA